MLTFVRCTYQVTVVTKAAGEPQLRWMSEEASHTHHDCTHHGILALAKLAMAVLTTAILTMAAGLVLETR